MAACWLWLCPIGCGCELLVVWFSLFLGVNSFAGVEWRQWHSIPFLNQAMNILSHCFLVQSTFTNLSVIIFNKKEVEGEICSQFIKPTKEKSLSPLICQQQHNNSFSLGKTNANNNSQDSGSGVVLKKGDFQLLAPSSLPFPKDTLPNYRNK